jgi:hypothetical protein
MAGGLARGFLAAASALIFATACANSPTRVFDEIPTQIDPRRNYVIYLHGLWVELHGPDAFNDRYGVRYQLDAITEELAKRDLTVIAQVRPRATRATKFAQTVASQVRTLIGRGATAGRITVVGHSKGGLIALLAASMVSLKDVRYVILAGCGKRGSRFRRGYTQFLDGRTIGAAGDVLSLYDAADHTAGTCREIFDRADFTGDEMILDTRRGHGLFYTPETVWLEPVVRWATR